MRAVPASVHHIGVTATAASSLLLLLLVPLVLDVLHLLEQLLSGRRCSVHHPGAGVALVVTRAPTSPHPAPRAKTSLVKLPWTLVKS